MQKELKFLTFCASWTNKGVINGETKLTEVDYLKFLRRLLKAFRDQVFYLNAKNAIIPQFTSSVLKPNACLRSWFCCVSNKKNVINTLRPIFALKLKNLVFPCYPRLGETEKTLKMHAAQTLTAVKLEKFAKKTKKNKKITSKERLSLPLFKVLYFASMLLIY